MFVRAKVTECDFDGYKFEKPVEGAHGICRGASGRWCCVMYFGPEYLQKNNIEVISHDAAVEYVLEHFPNDIIDF